MIIGSCTESSALYSETYLSLTKFVLTTSSTTSKMRPNNSPTMASMLEAIQQFGSREYSQPHKQICRHIIEPTSSKLIPSLQKRKAVAVPSRGRPLASGEEPIHKVLAQNGMAIWDFDGSRPITHRELKIKSLPLELWTEVFMYCRWDSLLALSETCHLFYSTLTGKERVGQCKSDIDEAKLRYSKLFWTNSIYRDLVYCPKGALKDPPGLRWPKLSMPFLDAISDRQVFTLIARSEWQMQCQNCPSVDASPRWYMRKILCFNCINQVVIDETQAKQMLEKLIIQKNFDKINEAQKGELREGWKYLPFDFRANTSLKPGPVYSRAVAGRFIKTLENALKSGTYDQWRLEYLKPLIANNPVAGLDIKPQLLNNLMNIMAHKCRRLVDRNQQATIRMRNRTMLQTFSEILPFSINLHDTRLFQAHCVDGPEEPKELTFEQFVEAIPVLKRSNDVQYNRHRTHQDRMFKSTLFSSIASFEYTWLLTKYSVYSPGLYAVMTAATIQHSIQTWHNRHSTCCTYHQTVGNFTLTMPDLIHLSSTLELALHTHNNAHGQDPNIHDDDYMKIFYCPFANPPTRYEDRSIRSLLQSHNCTFRGPHTLSSLLTHIIQAHPKSCYNPAEVTPTYPLYDLLVPHSIRDNRVRRWVTKNSRPGVMEINLVHYVYPFDFDPNGPDGAHKRKFPQSLEQAEAKMAAFETGFKPRLGEVRVKRKKLVQRKITDWVEVVAETRKGRCRNGEFVGGAERDLGGMVKDGELKQTKLVPDYFSLTVSKTWKARRFCKGSRGGGEIDGRYDIFEPRDETGTVGSLCEGPKRQMDIVRYLRPRHSKNWNPKPQIVDFL